jgi:hypothetical protein
LTHLTFFNLSRNQLFGTIPKSLGTLTALADLWLQNNQLRGTIPSSLGILTTLIQLYLYNNLLSGTIPSSLGALTALISLSLERNHLSGTIPSSLGALTALARRTLAALQSVVRDHSVIMQDVLFGPIQNNYKRMADHKAVGMQSKLRPYAIAFIDASLWNLEKERAQSQTDVQYDGGQRPPGKSGKAHIRFTNKAQPDHKG